MQDELTEGKRDPRADTPRATPEELFEERQDAIMGMGEPTATMHRREEFEVDLTTCKGEDVKLPTSTLLDMLAQNALGAAIRMETLEQDLKDEHMARKDLFQDVQELREVLHSRNREIVELRGQRNQVTDELIDLKEKLHTAEPAYTTTEIFERSELVVKIDALLGEGWTRNLLGALTRAAK